MVVIIGAGPAGLATAYYLQRYGVAFKILEQHEVASTWSRMYDHLHLHSLKQHSGLPGLPMPEDYPDFPSAFQVHEYLQHYARHFKFDVQTQTKVLSVSYDNAWRLETSRGLVEVSKLVVATGIYNTPFIPEIEGLESFQGQVLHSQQYKRPQDFLGKKVLVVGVGNSGAEIAVALADTEVQTDIVVRDGVLMVSYPRSFVWSSLSYWALHTLPGVLSNFVLARTQKNFAEIGLPLPNKEPVKRYPLVGFDLAQFVRNKNIRIRSTIQQVTADSVHFVSGESETYDTIICATGFRPTLDFLTPELQNHPDVYTVGFCYPTTEPFLLALKRQAKRLALKLAKG